MSRRRPAYESILYSARLREQLGSLAQQRSADLKRRRGLKAMGCEFPNLIDTSSVLEGLAVLKCLIGGGHCCGWKAPQ